MLTKDKEISPQEFAEIQTFAQFSYGKNLALYHLSFKARTEKEVRDYLVKHEIDEKIIPQVIQALKDDNWINDRQYAYAIINSNQLSGDKGSYMLIQKISQKGVAKAVIQDVLQEFDLTEVAERTAEKLLKKYQGKLPARALQDKIIQNLTNRGFSYSEAKTAFDQLDSQVEEETVQELIFKELDKQYRKYSRKYEGYELKQRFDPSFSTKRLRFFGYSQRTQRISLIFHKKTKNFKQKCDTIVNDKLINCRKLVSYETSKRRRLYYNSKL